MEIATFAAGCFWGVEEIYLQTKGVHKTTVGYTGGGDDAPTYDAVCSGATGHAEAVEVEYDPAEVTYETLLDIFWINHDPTTLNRQGPDIGTQYRSAIFYHTEQQRLAAETSKQSLQQSPRFRKRSIVTQIRPTAPFHPAEEYHQQYLRRTGQASCHISSQQ